MAELAIATPQFQVSETFIIDHVRTIAPGRTVLMCMDHPADALPPGTPFLTDRGRWRALAGRVARRVPALRPALSWADEMRRAAFLREHRPRAILVEYLNYATHYVGVARGLNLPLYAYAHGFDVAEGFRDDEVRRAYQTLFERAAGIVVASRFMRDKLVALGCPMAKLHIIPCGIEPGDYKPSTREPGRLLAVGRLVEKKAPHLTLEAFALVLRDHPSARLDMIGDGPLRELCEATIERLDLARNVTLRGAQPREVVKAALSHAAILVQHSVTAANGDTEGLGVSLLEAMASHIPVVATRHNGFTDTVADGETGILVPEGDVEGMAAAISDLIGDSERARAMGEAGRHRVEDRFSLEGSARRLRALMGLRARRTSECVSL